MEEFGKQKEFTQEFWKILNKFGLLVDLVKE